MRALVVAATLLVAAGSPLLAAEGLAWETSLEQARTHARGRHQLLVFLDDQPRSGLFAAAFAGDAVQAYADRVVFVRLPYGPGTAWTAVYEVNQPASVVLLDPAGRRVAASAFLSDGRSIAFFLRKWVDTTYLIRTPTSIMVYLLGLVALLYLLASWAPLKGFFNYVPPLTWCYFLPMIGTTLGLTPDESEACTWFSDHALPLLVILLLMSCDIRGIAKLGPKAIVLALIGSVGIFVGALIAFAAGLPLAPMFGAPLPDEAWKGVAALSGSWTGGTANLAAIARILNAAPEVVAPLIIVDTVVAYTWMGIMIWLVAFQARYDRWRGATSRVVEQLEGRMRTLFDAHRRPLTASDFGIILGFAFVVSELCLLVARAWIPPWQFEQVHGGARVTVTLLSKYGWGMLLVTAVGTLLSFTPAQKLEYAGASSIGSMLLYLFLATFGLQANLKAILQAPTWMLVGLLWLLVHIGVLATAAYLLRAPLFLFSIASMANVGGTASCPVLASAYNRSLTPVGLLMAILCGLYANPFGILVARICHWIQHG